MQAQLLSDAEVGRHPPVLLVMPVFNGERHLREAVESVLRQTYRNLEFVAIDDGSTDSSAEILRQYATTDPRMRVVTVGRNLGAAISVNRVVQASTAEFFARLDQDDLAYPERIARQVDYLVRHPAIGLLGTWTRAINDDGDTLADWRWRIASADIPRHLLFSNCLVHSSVMCRMADLKAVGGYGTATLGRGCRDYELWLRLSEVTGVAILEEVLTGYRVHPSSSSMRHNVLMARSARDCRQLARRRRFKPNEPDCVPPLTVWNELRGHTGSVGYDLLAHTQLHDLCGNWRAKRKAVFLSLLFSPLSSSAWRAAGSWLTRSMRPHRQA
jgi:glycosyltransferase involved in cell wall biosynthesis